MAEILVERIAKTYTGGKTPAVDYSTKVSVDKGHTLDVRLDFNEDHTVSGHIADKSVSDKW